MENIVFDRNYELVSEDNSFADAVYEKAIEPDGFFASFGKKMDRKLQVQVGHVHGRT